MAAVVKAIITSRNCSISSSSSSGRSSSCNSSSITLSLLQKKKKNSNSDGGDNSKKNVKGFLASVPKLRITTVMRHRLKSYNVLMLSLRAASG